MSKKTTAELKRPIVIKESNRARIEAVLDDVQSRCKVRTISVNDILKMPDIIMRKTRLPKYCYDGCTYDIDLKATSFSSAYNGIPMSTHFCIRCTHGTWKLLWIRRAQVREAKRAVYATLTETAIEKIIEANRTFSLYLN